MKENNLEKDLKISFEIFSKNYESIFPRWIKEESHDSLDEVRKYIGDLQGRNYPSDNYKRLKTTEKKGKAVVYSFNDYPGSDSIAAQNRDYSPTIYKVKVIPKLEFK